MNRENEVAKEVVDACVKVHRVLGPGLLESVYEAALAYELRNRKLTVASQVPIAISCEGVSFEVGFRADLVIEDCVIVELKSIENVLPVHKKQLLTYLRLSNKTLGLLLNFGNELMKDGIFRIIN